MHFFLFSLIITTLSTSCFAQVTNPITGRTWMDRNLGASQVATSIDDTASFGSLYQWGRLSDGHENITSITTNVNSSSSNPGHSDFIIGFDDWLSPSDDNLWQGVNGINNPCPNGYRIPTIAEWEEERLSWTTNNAAGAFDSPLKLPIAGARSRMSGMIGNVGTFVGYRSSDLNGVDSKVMGVSLNDAFIGNRARADGNCVRCIQDQSLNVINIPDSESLKVYPIPATNNIIISANEKFTNERYIIQNTLGSILLKGRIEVSDTIINIDDLPSGVYFLRVGSLAPIKFIKQ